VHASQLLIFLYKNETPTNKKEWKSRQQHYHHIMHFRDVSRNFRKERKASAYKPYCTECCEKSGSISKCLFDSLVVIRKINWPSHHHHHHKEQKRTTTTLPSHTTLPGSFRESSRKEKDSKCCTVREKSERKQVVESSIVGSVMRKGVTVSVWLTCCYQKDQSPPSLPLPLHHHHKEQKWTTTPSHNTLARSFRESSWVRKR